MSNTLTPPDLGDLDLWLRRTVGHLVDLVELDATRDDEDEETEEQQANFEEMQDMMEDVEITQ
jgi:hypothetical protein